MSGSKLAGIFTERDYTRKIALHGKTSKETRVWEIMPKEIISVTPDDSVEECMRLMTDNRVRHLPVVEGAERRRHHLHRRPGELDHFHPGRDHRADGALHRRRRRGVTHAGHFVI